jgi:hypothetical protein
MKVDQKLPDKWPPMPQACSSGTAPLWVGNAAGKTMAICVASPKVAHCAAANECAAPDWHVCTLVEYPLFFPKGSTVPPDVSDAWLMGCIANGSGLVWMDSGPCASGSCNVVCGSWNLSTGTACGGGSGTLSTCGFLGVKTSPTCHAIGPVVQHEAMWIGEPVVTGLSKVACCR